MRIVFFSHSHPGISKGGGEISAYNSFLQARLDGHECLFIYGRSQRAKPGKSNIIRKSRDEYSIEFDYFDDFGHISADLNLFWSINNVLIEFRPDVVHFHHFWNIGVDLVFFLSNTLKQVVFVITLHEFLAICHHSGQMITTGGELCKISTPESCSACFPQISPKNFEVRKSRIVRALECFDVITTPSEFVAQRLYTWGNFPAIIIIENGLVISDSTPYINDVGDVSSSFAYFGQITAFKGIDIMVAAVIDYMSRGGVVAKFYVHGVTREAFILQFGIIWRQYIDAMSEHLFFMGPYVANEAVHLMSRYGYIVVPSIWWENSPLVIQEAFAAGRPVIATNLGGMREKVEHNKNGMLFERRDHTALSRIFSKLSGNNSEWMRLRAGIRPVRSIKSINEDLYQIYKYEIAKKSL